LGHVVGGRLEYEGEGVAAALRLFRELVIECPRELSIQAQLTTDVYLAPQLVVVPCYTGESEDPEVLRPLRAVPGLVNDDVRRQGFLEQQRIFDPGYAVDRNYWKGHFVAELPDRLIDDLIGRMTVLRRPPGGILIESLHGGPKDVDPASAALGYRDAAFNVSVMASWTDPAHDEESIEWARTTAATIEPSADPRRLRQLHAGRRTHRPRPRGLRPRLIRAPPGVEVPLRPGQPPAPQPKHSAGRVGRWRRTAASLRPSHPDRHALDRHGSRLPH